MRMYYTGTAQAHYTGTGMTQYTYRHGNVFQQVHKINTHEKVLLELKFIQTGMACTGNNTSEWSFRGQIETIREGGGVGWLD